MNIRELDFFLLQTVLLNLCISEPQQPSRLERVRNTLRLKHMSLKTEKYYIYNIKQFTLFHHKRHPREIGVEGLEQISF